MFDSVRTARIKSPDAVIVGVFKNTALDKSYADPDGAIAAAAKRPEFSAEVGSAIEAFPAAHASARAGKPAAPLAPRVIIVGLGQRDKLRAGDMRHAAAAAAKKLAACKADSAGVHLSPALFSAGAVDPFEAGWCFGEGLGLAAWSPDMFKGAAQDRPRRAKLAVAADAAEFSEGLETGIQIASAANLARSLSQTPPNIATTTYIANQAKALARRTGMSCRVIQGAELEKERLTGLINVGKASENPPCLIRLEYKPQRPARAARPLVLIGKTMIYDSGGLSIKPAGSMAGMKRDKDGGCAVLGAMAAIAQTIRPNRPVVALLACAENSISDEAYRPDDILTFRNGVTVEVTNTDAEGRLVLADALCWAVDHEKPAEIIDLATLTGGVVVALGSTFAGLWCDDDRLRMRIERAADASGERVWRLPHHAEYRDMMKSSVADILNSNPNRKAHPIQGAAFLSYFVPDNIPWAHIDIAGVHAADSDSGPFCKGPTGWGVRLLAELLAGD